MTETVTDAYLEILEEGYFEAKIAFDDLADENVWKRPAPGLLSLGELAGHIAYWEAIRLAGEGGTPTEVGFMQPDLSKCQVSSPLIDTQFAYYTATINTLPSEAHRAMTAEQVCHEMVRVHEEAVAHFRAFDPDLKSTPTGWPPPWTYRSFLTYLAFHVAYHTGQIYTVRHLLGDTPPDN